MKTASTPARWNPTPARVLGIVRLDGAVVFVPQAVRGETIDLKITKVMKTAAAGEIVKIHKPSPGPGRSLSAPITAGAAGATSST